MQGIMIKELYECCCIKKNLISLIVNFVFLLAIIIALKNLYGCILVIGITLPMMGISVFQSAIEQDEISKYDQILLTFPITVSQIIKAKMMTTFLFTVVINVVVSLPVTLLYVLGYQAVSLKMGILIFVLGFIAALIFNAVTTIGFLWLGNSKGAIMYIIMVSLIAIGYIIFNFNFDIKTILTSNTSLIIIVMILIALILTVISYFISIKIYQSKHS